MCDINMASSGGGAFAHLQSVDDVRYEIQIQNTILLSLEDGPQDDNTPNEIREARQTLKALYQLLKTREAQAQGILGRPLPSKVLITLTLI